MADKTAIEWTDATWNPIRAVRLIGTKEEICSKCKELQAEAESWFARLLIRSLHGRGL